MSNFQYDAANIASIERWLSRDRLAKYLSATGNDLESAIRLHSHNTGLSAAFFGPIQIFEIALRNAFDQQLRGHYGPTWHDEATFLVDQEIINHIDKVKDKLAKMHMPVDTPHIVAELNFGFWTLLTAGRYEHTMWTPFLSKAFPNYFAVTGKKVKRGTISGQLNHLRLFRNRIAHHEPIFQRDLSTDYSTLLSVASWIEKELDTWIAFHSRVPFVLPKRELF